MNEKAFCGTGTEYLRIVWYFWAFLGVIFFMCFAIDFDLILELVNANHFFGLIVITGEVCLIGLILKELIAVFDEGKKNG